MKKSLVFALALMLVVAFASSAMAAQVILGTPSSTNPANYASTTTGVYYDATASTSIANVYKNHQAGKFTADGTTNYPYEIYIPNELNPGEYRIHSSYAKNTDACASCHSTHTAVGNTLLQWYSTYETCMACHDGTVTTTYNVVEGEYVSQNGLKVTAMGGAFGDEGSAFSSNHNVTGALQISAAPGGSTTAETVTLANGPQSRWTPTFGCESCHTPHGAGGNARILHPDTNFVASQAKVNSGYAVVGGVVYKGAIASGNETYLLKGYPYTISIQNAGIEVPGAYIDNQAGYSVVMGGVAEKVYGTPSLKVTMSISNYLSYDDPDEKEVVGHVYGMNFFCGACHTDYNTAAFTTEHSSDQSLGDYSKAHRHQVGVPPLYNNTQNGNKNNLPDATMVLEGGNLECLTCHVAHGVNADFWKKTVGSTGTAYLADGDLEELAGSSALKRLPNMGTCEACHQKGASAEGYAIPGLGSENDDQAQYTPNTYNYAAKAANYDTGDKGWVGNAACAPCHKEFVDGWQETKHATSKHTGGCGGCHNPGNTIMGNVGVFATALAGDPIYDAGITCESCHGSGRQHVSSPSSKNIFNPGIQDIRRQAIECGRCHDMYSNSVQGFNTNLSVTSGAYYFVTSSSSVYKTKDMDALGTWSPAFRVSTDDPAKFAIASQFNVQSNHFGGSWGYADSKHYLGFGGTPQDPKGVVTCTTCHDMHDGEHAGVLKFEEADLCGACHGSSSTLPMLAADLAQEVAMPSNSWERHNIDGRDFAHSFKFGPAVTSAQITSAQVEIVNREFAWLATGLCDVITGAAGITSGVVPASGATEADKHANLFPGATRTGAIGAKVAIFNGATQLFNNYGGTYTLTENAPAVEDLTGVTGYEFEAEVGEVIFAPTAANKTGGGLTGDWTITWTSNINPLISDSATVHIN